MFVRVRQMDDRRAHFTTDWVTGQWSCRSNDSTDAPTGTQCILGYLSNPRLAMALGWSGPSPSLVRCVCMCSEPTLMIVGNLNWAIVILMELHGKAYRFTEGKQKKHEGRWVGKRSEKESGKLPHSTQPFPPLRKNMGSRESFCYESNFRRNFGMGHRRLCVYVFAFHNEDAEAWINTSLSPL